MGTSDQDSLVHRIVSVVAEGEGVSPNELTPLSEFVDVDGLQAFLESANAGARAEFDYLGRRIAVRSDGRVTVSDPMAHSDRYVARCNTCDEEHRTGELDAAQDFFSTHADDHHAVEINRIEGGRPNPTGESTGTGDRRTGKTD